MDVLNQGSGKVAIPCDHDQKAVRPGSEMLLDVRISLCMSFTGTRPYRRHWSTRLSDEIFVAVI